MGGHKFAQKRAHGTARLFLSLHRGCQNGQERMYRVILGGDVGGMCRTMFPSRTRSCAGGPVATGRVMMCLWHILVTHRCREDSVLDSFACIYKLYGNRFLGVSKAADVTLGVYMIP
jgi:hypothetical protein